MPVPAGMPEDPVTRVGHVIYLHGFASSPESSKAQRFGRELAARGVSFDCPDLNQPEFRTLTVTRMLEQVRQAIDRAPAAPIAIIGSSLGAFVALFASCPEPLDSRSGLPERSRRERAAKRRVEGLILLAPAVDFGGNRLRQLGEHGIDEWRRKGSIPFFHYGWNQPEEVGFALYEDAARYDAFALDVTVPTLVFHGHRDAAVDPASVERWAAGRPNVDLRMLDDDHQLTSSIELIWDESRKFLGL
jgi:pimeloyl-ACP methyl ester carboxylesterase